MPGLPWPPSPLLQYKAAEVGLKLTAGFEMMFANRARFGQAEEEGDGEQQQTGPNGAAGSLAGDAGWAAFQARLERTGYFGGSLPGSVQHSQLLQAAAESYRQTEAYRRSTAALAAPALCVDELLRLPADAASLPPAAALPPEGSEAWLHADAGRKIEAELEQRQAEFEQRKQQRRQPQRAAAAAAAAKAAASGGVGGEGAAGGEGFDPRELAGQLRAFVDLMSGIEGAEVPSTSGGGGGAGAAAGGSSSSGGAAAGAAGGVDLDETKFAAELQRVLGLVGRGAGGWCGCLAWPGWGRWLRTADAVLREALPGAHACCPADC